MWAMMQMLPDLRLRECGTKADLRLLRGREDGHVYLRESR